MKKNRIFRRRGEDLIIKFLFNRKDVSQERIEKEVALLVQKKASIAA